MGKDYEWIKKLTKDADKRKKGKKFSDYVDNDKKEKVKKSFADRFKKIKELLKRSKD